MKKKVMYKLPRTVEDKETGRKIVMNKLEKFYVDPEKDLGTSTGVITKNSFEKNGKFEEGKDKYVVHDSSFIDNYKQIKRKAQIITLKDIGPIVAYTGINSDSDVMDAGVGSGALSCFLGKIAKEVHAFDVEEGNIEVAKKNVSDLKLNNVKVEKGDVYSPDEFKEGYYDVFTLDVPDPVKALKTANKVLKVGGWLVVYAPQITQIQEVVTNLPENFIHDISIEVIERLWKVTSKVLRPVTKDFGHTAFLCFIRKIN